MGSSITQHLNLSRLHRRSPASPNPKLSRFSSKKEFSSSSSVGGAPPSSSVLLLRIPLSVGSTRKQTRAKLGYIDIARHTCMSHTREILRVPAGSTGPSVELVPVADFAYFAFAGQSELDFRECVALPQCGHGCFV